MENRNEKDTCIYKKTMMKFLGDIKGKEDREFGTRLT